MKLLILGYARHGKDTVADILKADYGLSFSSSSWFACKQFIFKTLAPLNGYATIEECFKDRVNCRATWFKMICEFNKKDNSRLIRAILKENDIYVGLRSKDELKEGRELFDKIIWVDAMERVGVGEDISSCTVTPDDADMILDNNGTKEQLAENLARIMRTLKRE